MKPLRTRLTRAEAAFRHLAERYTDWRARRRPRRQQAGSGGVSGRAPREDLWRDERSRAIGRSIRNRGFTLIEILLVIALIGLFSVLFVVNLESLMRQSDSDSVETAFWQATREARTRALVERHTQTVRFDEKAEAFVVEEGGGVNTRVFAISKDDWSPETKLEVAFQKSLPASQYSLVQGRLVELREVASVEFYPDGTCTPFTVAMTVGSSEHSIEIDPWTGAELLPSEDES